MLEIYMVRHGLTKWNIEGRFQGSQDVELADEGILQAEKVRDRLKNLTFDAIYSSDLIRAYKTAEIIAEPHDCGVIPLEGLREIHMGVWEGLLWDEIMEQYPETLKMWKESPTKARISEAEGVESAGKRVYETFKQLIQKHIDDQRILLVSHGLVIATLLCQIEGLCLDQWYSRRQENTGVSIVHWDGEELNPVLVNCTEHYGL